MKIENSSFFARVFLHDFLRHDDSWEEGAARERVRVVRPSISEVNRTSLLQRPGAGCA